MIILKKYNHIHSNVAISDEREEKDMMRERARVREWITSTI